MVSNSSRSMMVSIPVLENLQSATSRPSTEVPDIRPMIKRCDRLAILYSCSIFLFMMQHNFCRVCPNLQINCTMRKIYCLWQRHRVLFALYVLMQTFSFISPAQVVVSGKVTGSDGKALAAVTVQISNTTAA